MTTTLPRPPSSETEPLLLRDNSSDNNNNNYWCWFVLFAFSLLSFSSALMWDTFAPCLYIFAEYYFDGNITTATVNAINAMSLIYMLIYPLAVQPTLRFFEDDAVAKCPGSGLKRGILIGASLNMLGGAIRWFGGAQDRYVVLFMGQTVAAIGTRFLKTWKQQNAISLSFTCCCGFVERKRNDTRVLILLFLAQVFMLSIPPRLAGTWFRESQVNISTSIGVSSNNLGVAAGSIWAPLAVHAATMTKDIPRLLFWQFLLCVLAWALIYIAFSRSPSIINTKYSEGTSSNDTVNNYKTNNDDDDEEDETTPEEAPAKSSNAYEQAKVLWSHRSFYHLLLSYGIINGGQCALVTLLAQVLLPSFQDGPSAIDEGYIGWVGFMMLLAGIPASWAVGFYLDRTFQYRVTCNALAILSSLSIAGMYVAIELQYLPAVTFNCIIFGLASSAIIPAVFQYASELYYPIDENIPAGYLCTASNLSGVLLAVAMGWTENNKTVFSMRLPVLGLVLITFISNISMFRVKGPLKRHGVESASHVQ
ncbi:major facilitator superfamily domain-containing protein [Zychaea mexicana]|uniref:major facilitator superfamily domain-containing protein n=1 Tax=Zychaea mexicana TaxID=64656 RepID=UPI0022FE166C|nr:major facilitator superfamily domain-containing protein [Zychaea mexicana]KAI9493642.1 major facilitator superfamily domain-containing protein [Zychaea mexicana]